MRNFRCTVGDGKNQRRDLDVDLSWEGDGPSDEDVQDLVICAFRPDREGEKLIEDAEVIRDDDGISVVVLEGPGGECASNAGPWLVARLQEIEG